MARKRKTPARLGRTGALAKGWNYRWNISNISFDGNNQVGQAWEKRSSNGCQKTTEEAAGSAYGIRTRGLRPERQPVTDQLNRGHYQSIQPFPTHLFKIKVEIAACVTSPSFLFIGRAHYFHLSLNCLKCLVDESDLLLVSDCE